MDLWRLVSERWKEASNDQPVRASRHRRPERWASLPVARFEAAEATTMLAGQDSNQARNGEERRFLHFRQTPASRVGDRREGFPQERAGLLKIVDGHGKNADRVAPTKASTSAGRLVR